MPVDLCTAWTACITKAECWQVATIYRLPAGKAPETLENGQQLKFEEPAYELGPGGQGEFHTDILRLVYTSLTTPTSTLDHNMATGKR